MLSIFRDTKVVNGDRDYVLEIDYVSYAHGADRVAATEPALETFFAVPVPARRGHRVGEGTHADGAVFSHFSSQHALLI